MQPNTAPLCAHCGQPLPQHLPSSPAAERSAPPADPEARVFTHDGHIWPLDRHEMRVFRHVRTRMVEDATELLRGCGEEGVVLIQDLQGFGWTREQVLEHGARAAALADEGLKAKQAEAA
jgi:hypothetical protein